jgi:hypothetical protein
MKDKRNIRKIFFYGIRKKLKLKKNKSRFFFKSYSFLLLIYIFFISQKKNNNFFFNQFFFKYISLWKIFNFQKKLLYFFFFYRLNIHLKYFFKFYQIYSGNFNSSLIANYIVTKLSQKFQLFQIINPLLNNLLKFGSFIGFKILCAGRFARKQIATYTWQKKGKVSLNTFKNFIDYSFYTVRLKNSLCGIKVWINFSPHFIYLKELKTNLILMNTY